jgi:hypothetical protein
MASKKSLIQNIVLESKAYEKLDDITRLVDSGNDLTNIPLQPLYMVIASSSMDEVSRLLPNLSKEQREALVGLDMWNRDVIDVNGFNQWIQIYSKSNDDEVVKDFVATEDFFLYLKSVANIWTFDTEEPEYPDHDYYFLTDDNLLLVEYSEHYQYPHELKHLIRHMYDDLGVENAYSLLFKLINDSFPELQEIQYQENKERLREYGFVDYYDARAALHEFIGEKSVISFINNKVEITGNIDALSMNQSLHSSSLINFSDGVDELAIELDKVQSEKRLKFLHFNFIRLVNSTISLNDALKKGRIELTKIGAKTRNYLRLGLSFVQACRGIDSAFDYFDFSDLYKIGVSLLEIQKRKIKKSLSTTPFDSNEYEYFLGLWWNSFLEGNFQEVPKAKAFGAGLHAKEINSAVVYEFWKKQVTCFVQLMPFANSFFEVLKRLTEEGKVNDQFYMNYEVDNIDFEAIMISSLINLSHGFYDQDKTINKMGLTVSELKDFTDKYFTKKGSEYYILPFENKVISELISGFKEKFGFDSVESFDEYLYGILSEHLNGYEYGSLDEDDFAHVGGPILLKNIRN